MSLTKWTNWLKWVFSISLVFLLAFYFKTEFKKVDFSQVWSKISLFGILFAIFGSLLNWFIEAIKWQILISKLQKNRLLTSFKAVLSGTAVSNIFPFKLGEYLGKLYFVKPEFKEQSLVYSLICSLTQLIVNLTFTFLLGYRKIGIGSVNLFSQKYIIIICMVIALVSLLGFYKFANFKRVLDKFLFAFKSVNKTTLFKLFGLSCIRLAVFYTTYTLILMQITNIAFFEILEGIGAIYFLQSFAPGMVITDSAVRIALPLYIFSWYSFKEEIIAAAILNYTASMVFPSFLGLGCILHSLTLKK